jgi:transcription antitermination protein NusB
MPARHRSRQHALQVLYQWDMRKQPWEEAVESFYESVGSPEGETRLPRDEFMELLVSGTVARCPEIDAQIGRHSEHWRLERMSVVDRNILRLAMFEMNSQETPAAVVIDEALELARRFSGDESVPFINGVLDAIRKEEKVVEPQAEVPTEEPE